MKIGRMNNRRSTEAMQSLRAAEYVILPSLLQCDFGNLQREIVALEEAGVRGLHLDVMDGHFVPNLTYGAPIVEGIRKLTQLPLDVHLMISEPVKYVQQFVDAGADCLTVHAEIVDPVEVLQTIQAAGVGTGIALNPGTDLVAAEMALPWCDLVLVMSVDAGFGGQKFNPVALEKLKTLTASHPDLLLEVDGGVNLDTIANCYDAGARLLVVGSAIFGKSNYRQAIEGLAAAVVR